MSIGRRWRRPDEQRLWRASRRFYEVTSRASQLPVVGAPLRSLLEALTHIPHLYPLRDLSAPTFQARSLDRLIRKGLGRGLADHLQGDRRAAADHLLRARPRRRPPRLRAGLLPRHRLGHQPRLGAAAARAAADPLLRAEPAGGAAAARLRRGARADRVHRLPAAGRAARRAGPAGAAAQPGRAPGAAGPRAGLPRPDPRRDPSLPGRPAAPIRRAGRRWSRSRWAAPARRPSWRGACSRSLQPLIEEGRLRLCLVAGVRAEVAASSAAGSREAGLGAADRAAAHPVGRTSTSYFPRFNALLAETDILWTKPSEMTFFAALGLPLVLRGRSGVHERYNRRWAVENGARPQAARPRLRRLLDPRVARRGHPGRRGLVRLPALAEVRAVPDPGEGGRCAAGSSRPGRRAGSRAAERRGRLTRLVPI